MSEEGGSSPETVERPRPKRALKAIPIAALLIAAGFGVWYFLIRDSRSTTNVIAVSGRVESDDAVIAPKTGGRVREIKVREGDQVRAGDVVALLDDDQVRAREEQAQAAVTQAEARVRRAEQQIGVLKSQRVSSQLGVEQAKIDARGRVDQAEANVLQVRSQVSQAESQVAQAESQLEQARTNLQQARYDEEKAERLFKTGDVPERQWRQARTIADSQASAVRSQQRQVDVAKRALEVSRNALKSAQAAVTTAKATLGNPAIRASQTSTIDEQITQAESDIESANADAERARAQLREANANRADLEIKAPFDGTVATRSVEPGEVVAAGTPILSIVNLGAVYLRAYVPESEIGRVRIGQPARIFLDSAPDSPLEAEVARIDPEAMFTPENTYFRDDRVKQVIGVKLLVKQNDGAAKPGMPADGEILVSGDWRSVGRSVK